MKKPAPRVPWQIVLVVLTFIAPTELSLYLGGLRLPWHRIALLFLIPFAVHALITRRDLRLKSFDALFVAFGLWTVGAFAAHGLQVNSEGTQVGGIVYGVSLAVEALGGYCVARAWVRDVQTFRAVVRLLFAVAAVAGLIALPETLLAQLFTHDLLQQVTGYVHPRVIEVRLGLARAYGTFDHPIHLGTFCASIVGLVWYSERGAVRRNLKIAVLAIATFTSLSSAPMLCIAVQGALIAWEVTTRGVSQRLAISAAVLCAFWVGVSLVSNRSIFALIATGLTLDPWTGFYRLMIWQHGLENVAANVWSGIGLANWARPDWMVAETVDAFGLVIAMRMGVPAAAFLALALVLLLWNTARQHRRSRDRDARQMSRGWAMALAALILASFTVHYWNAIHAYFFFLVGLGGWCADPVKLRARKRAMRATMPRGTHGPARHPPLPVFHGPVFHGTVRTA